MDELNELNELEIEKAFAEAYQSTGSTTENKEKRDCYPYSVFNACRNLGKIYCRIFPAISNGKLTAYKTINDVFMGSVPFPKSNGEGEYYRTLRLVNNSDYICELTPEAIELNNNLHKEVEKYNQNCIDKGAQWGPFKHKKVTLFYAMIKRVVDLSGKKTDYSDPNITCVYYTSKGFSESLNKAITNKTEAKESNSWLREFFSRKTGMNVNFTIIDTSRPEIKYEHQISFEDLPSMKFEIKEDDLNSASDLDVAFVNTKSFDIDFYKEMYNRVVELNKEMSNDPNLEDHHIGGENKNLE